MIHLSLKDSRQQNLAPGILVYLHEEFLIIENENLLKKYRLSNDKVTQGNFWIDPLSKGILVELWDDNSLLSLLSINLGEDFESLFPEAYVRWNGYFLKVHYSF
jgi:hypothetical protein